MNTLTRALFLTAWATAAGLFSGCSDKAEDMPAPADPAPTYQMAHYFYYPATNGGAGASHPSQDVKATARLLSPVLALDFQAGPDGPHFEIDRAQLKAAWVGTYALRCRARPTDPVFVSYSYSNSTGSRIFRFSDSTQELTGHVTITAYDAKRQLVSGEYEVTAPNQRDPASDEDRKCDITISGKFTNMKVKSE